MNDIFANIGYYACILGGLLLLGTLTIVVIKIWEKVYERTHQAAAMWWFIRTHFNEFTEFRKERNIEKPKCIAHPRNKRK